ncbi:MAG: glutathione S-transferase [Rhodospirillales bacterium]|nr:glutathione S-transferase [Rhodospirillales bacterium]
MIELLGMSSPNVQKIQIMLEECELPYRIRRIDVWKGENFTPEFEAINPNRKVPVLIDDDGPDGGPCTIFESGAILIYLAEKTGRFLPTRGAARYEVLEWLAVQMCGVGPMFGQYTHFRIFAPKGNDYAENRYRTQAVRLFEVLDRRLGQARYLGGEDYSVADMATFPWTRDRAGKWGGDWDGYRHVQRWFADVAARPAVHRMTEEMDKVWAEDLVSIGVAPVELVDRLLGRGEFTQEPSA